MYSHTLSLNRSSSPVNFTQHRLAAVSVTTLWCLIKATVRVNKSRSEGERREKNNMELYTRVGGGKKFNTVQALGALGAWLSAGPPKTLHKPASSEKTQGFSLMDNALTMCSSASSLNHALFINLTLFPGSTCGVIRMSCDWSTI